MKQMALKIGLSVRYKILFLLTLLPLISLSLFLYLAMDTFAKDKVAYVFESSSSVSRSLATQISSSLNSTLQLAKPVLQEFLSLGRFDSTARSLLASEGAMDWVAAFELKSGRAVKLDLMDRTAGAGDLALGALGDLGEILRDAAITGRTVRVPFKDEKVLIAERVQTPGGDKFFLLVAPMAEVTQIFHSSSTSQLYLVNRRGFALLGSNGRSFDISQEMDLNFDAQLKADNISTSTEEMKTARGESWLASFSKVPFGDLVVVTLVPKKEALKAVENLLRRSVYFFLALICVTAIISFFASKAVISTLTELYVATKKVAAGFFDFRVKVTSTDEVGSLAENFNAMSAEVSRLMQETAEKARMESELKTAQMVQETLFPPTEADIGGLRVAGYYEPASECGGDWWHYCQVGQKVFLWIGDATGHGAPAALVTSAAKSAASIIERVHVGPAAALDLLNRAIYDVSKGQIMMTFFLACFDQETRQFTYSNASHESPFLIRPQDSPLKKKDLIPLNEVNNPRLGQSRDSHYQETSIVLEKGDRIFFYTDGLADIQSPQSTGWGEREFIKGIIASNQSFPPVAESVKALVQLFSTFRQGMPLIDDITFFMTQFEGGPT